MISVDHCGALPERDHLSQTGTACWESTEDQLCPRFERENERKYISFALSLIF